MQEPVRIEQLWYTWAVRGMEQISGFQVYAASEGLMDVNGPAVRAMNPYLDYSLPKGTERQAATKENSPSALVYMEKDGISALLQKNFSGSDSIGRIGTYFIHLLRFSSRIITAREAIELWRSPLWRTAVPEAAAQQDFKNPQTYELWPVNPAALIVGLLNEQVIRSDATFCRDLPFVLQAFLSCKEQQKLLIAADEPQVAMLIWGLAHCFPRVLLKNLSFSTYEADPLKATTRIIGTCLPGPEVRREALNAERLLPIGAFSEEYILLNCYTNQHSELPDLRALLSQEPLLDEYLPFAVNCLLGNTQMNRRLSALLESADRLELEGLGQLLFLFKLREASPQLNTITVADLTAILENSNFTIECLPLEHVQDALIRLAIQDEKWWKEKGNPALTNRAEQRNLTVNSPLDQILSTLANRVARSVAAALGRGEQPTFHTTYNILLTLAPADVDISPWLTLLKETKSFIPGQRCAWPLRKRLLRKWFYGANYIALEDIVPWLVISWEELEDLFSPWSPQNWRLPQTWLEYAVTQLMANEPMTRSPKKVKLLEQPLYWDVFSRALDKMYRTQNPEQQQTALTLLQTLSEQGFAYKLNLTSLFLVSAVSLPQKIEKILQCAYLNEAEQMSLFKSYFGLFFQSLPLFPSTMNMIQTYVRKLTVDDLLEPETGEMLKILDTSPVKEHLPFELQQGVFYKLYAGYAVCFGNRESVFPDWDESFLNQVGLIIRQLDLANQKKYMEYLCDTIILTLSHENDKKGRLMLFLRGFAIVTEKQAEKEFLLLLMRRLDTWKVPGSEHQQLLPYISLALELTLKDKKPPKIEDLLKALQGHIQSNFSAIEALGKNTWSNELWGVWEKASPTVRPKTIREKAAEFIPALPKWKRGVARRAAQKQTQLSPTVTSKLAELDQQTEHGDLQQAQQTDQEYTVVKPRNASEQEYNLVRKPEHIPDRRPADIPEQEYAAEPFAASEPYPSPTRAIPKSLERRDILGVKGRQVEPIIKIRIDKMCEIKKAYFPSLSSFTNSRGEALLDEVTELQKIINGNILFFQQRVQEELIDDYFIIDWIGMLQKGDQEHIYRDIERECNHILAQNDHSRMVRLHGNGFLRPALMLFLRRFAAIEDMGKTKWAEFLAEGREKIWPTIMYSGKEWPQD